MRRLWAIVRKGWELYCDALKNDTEEQRARLEQAKRDARDYSF